MRELRGRADWASLVELDASASGDYPETPATRHDPLSEQESVELQASGARAFGAWAEGALVAATVVVRGADRVETEFTVVQRAFRGRGVGTAVKAASILALAVSGAIVFGTGGAAQNEAILRSCAKLGYVVTERWVSFAAE
jgi:GNAT superfamily N-acetyltransferase